MGGWGRVRTSALYSERNSGFLEFAVLQDVRQRFKTAGRVEDPHGA